jgi:hypothetical protein
MWAATVEVKSGGSMQQRQTRQFLKWAQIRACPCVNDLEKRTSADSKFCLAQLTRSITLFRAAIWVCHEEWRNRHCHFHTTSPSHIPPSRPSQPCKNVITSTNPTRSPPSLAGDSHSTWSLGLFGGIRGTDQCVIARRGSWKLRHSNYAQCILALTRVLDRGPQWLWSTISQTQRKTLTQGPGL